MIKAINAWSFPGGLEGTLAPVDAIRLAREYGFSAVELTINGSGQLCVDSTREDALAIRSVAEEAGIGLHTVASGTYWGRSVGDVDPAVREAAVADLEKMIRITSWLGAKVLLTIPGAVDVFFLPDRAPQPYDQVIANAVQSLRQVAPLAEELGVQLGIENVWNKMLLTPGEMAHFLDQVGSSAVGSYLDVGNVLPFGYPEHWIQALGSRVVAVHVKDFRRTVGTAAGFVDLLEGDVNFPAVVAALRDAGYQGPLTAEMIPLYTHEPLVRVSNTSRALDAILAMG